MIRTAKILFCDNEHGTGDVSFPDLLSCRGEELAQHFINFTDSKRLRKQAKAQGWSYVDGIDYCQMCTEGNKEES